METVILEADTQYVPDYMTPHPHVILHHDGEAIEIDEDISGLIQNMWDRGFVTRFCCQGWDFPGDGAIDEHTWNAMPYRGYIAMPRTDRNFDLVVNLLQNFPRFAQNTPVSWDIEFSQNAHYGYQNTICIRFPKSDIPLLESFVVDHY